MKLSRFTIGLLCFAGGVLCGANQVYGAVYQEGSAGDLNCQIMGVPETVTILTNAPSAVTMKGLQACIKNAAQKKKKRLEANMLPPVQENAWVSEDGFKCTHGMNIWIMQFPAILPNDFEIVSQRCAFEALIKSASLSD